MVSPTEARADFTDALREIGVPCRIKYFDVSGADAGFDDDVTYTQSGSDLWVTGAQMPLDRSRGSYDGLLVQQGDLLESDQVIYVEGTTSLSGTWLIGVGSPAAREFGTVGPGVTVWTITGSPIYNKAYVRYLTNGSLP